MYLKHFFNLVLLIIRIFLIKNQANAKLTNPNNGGDAVFKWLSDCETFSCDWFCNNACNQPANDNPLVFVRVNGTYTCLVNSPDYQFADPVICQFVSYKLLKKINN